MDLNIVLVEPEIPQNTGNIIRTCANTGAKLHMVRPFGFQLTSKKLKRAGLDYHDLADVIMYDSLDDFFKINEGANFFFATTKGKKDHSEVDYEDGCFILFGKETAGLPEYVLDMDRDRCIRIPMRDIEEARSLNLSNSVAVVAYEALRQHGFDGLR